MHQQQAVFENIMGKGEIARNKQFHPFPQCFLLNEITVSPFVHIFDIISLFAVELEEFKIGISGKVLKWLLPHHYLSLDGILHIVIFLIWAFWVQN